MEEVVAFTRWVGLVVALFAALLVAPRVTSALWFHLRRGFRPVEDDVLPTPVHVREGVPLDREDDAEVLDTHTARRRNRHARRFDVGWLLELVESRAALVLVTGVVLVFAGDLVRLLPGGAVLAGDLVLVLVTFLVMRHVVYSYVPVERLVEGVRPYAARAHAPFDQLLRVVLLGVALTLLVTWPSQVGWQLASSGLGGGLRDQRVLVAWACELPWLLGLTWFVARQRLATAPATS